jgi:hypothetical protein
LEAENESRLPNPYVNLKCVLLTTSYNAKRMSRLPAYIRWPHLAIRQIISLTVLRRQRGVTLTNIHQPLGPRPHTATCLPHFLRHPDLNNG